MAADLNLVRPELKGKVLKVIEQCQLKGCLMRPSTGLRDPFEQGRLWRQSRSIEEITNRIDMFKKQGADFLAHCLESVGPQHGIKVTNTPPGLSWHQWGEAVDCFWLVNDKAEWSPDILIKGVNGYHVYTDAALDVGLNPGGIWNNKDWPHVQIRDKDIGVLDVYSIQEVNKIMGDTFGKP
ncbi:TPA: M15 family metallopeptidase [Klebsiella variicola subsp. variicola]